MINLTQLKMVLLNMLVWFDGEGIYNEIFSGDDMLVREMSRLILLTRSSDLATCVENEEGKKRCKQLFPFVWGSRALNFGRICSFY